MALFHRRRKPPHRRTTSPVILPIVPLEPEKFPINQNTLGVSTTASSDLINHAIRYSFAPIWKFLVPVDTQVIFRPGDKFYIHVKDGAGVEWNDEQEIRIAFWNSVRRDFRIIYQGFYMDVKEPTDIDRMAEYQIAELHVVHGGGWVYIEGFAPIAPFTISSDLSHFSLDTQRVRPRI